MEWRTTNHVCIPGIVLSEMSELLIKECTYTSTAGKIVQETQIFPKPPALLGGEVQRILIFSRRRKCKFNHMYVCPYQDSFVPSIILREGFIDWGGFLSLGIKLDPI